MFGETTTVQSSEILKWFPVRIGEALEFDGSGDFVNLTTLGDFGRQIGTASFEAWIKTSNGARWMTLINTHGGGMSLLGNRNSTG